MRRASPAALRHALETAHFYTKSGIDFVCVPVLDEADKTNLTNQAQFRIEEMLEQAEAQEAAQ